MAFWRFAIGVGPGDTFDLATDTTTRAWQAAHGLAADGVVGPATWSTVGIGGTHAPSPAPGPSPDPIGPPPPPSPSPAGAGPFGLSDSIQAREAQILEHIAEGHIDHDWAPLEYQADGHTVRVLVSRRALALSDPSGSRLIVSTTYPTAQKIADILGGAMLTSRISDEVWKHAPVKIAPLARPWSQDGTMAHTDRMAEQSSGLDRKVAEAGDDGGRLVANEGKDWIITRRNWAPPAGIGVEKPQGAKGSLHNGANFGWYLAGSPSHSPGGESVIQSIGLAHDRGHVDYSQLLRFVKRDSLTIDGAPVDYAAALADPALSPLLQDEGGTMPADRHPDL